LSDKGSFKDLVDLLAERYRILPDYIDTEGRLQKTKFETKLRILGAMGVHTDSVNSLNKALEQHEYAFWSQLSDPVLVVHMGNRPEYLQFRIPMDSLETDYTHKGPELEIRVNDEAGKTTCYRFDHTHLVLLEKKTVLTSTFGHYGAPFPTNLAVGYYTLHLKAAHGAKKRSQAVRVIVCPERAYLPPALEGDKQLAGLWVSLYAIRSDQNWGVGDFSDLKRLTAWAAQELKVAFIGINPLHSLFNRSPYNISPYSPASRLYRNFIYLDIPGIGDFERSQRAREFISTPENQRLIVELRTSEEVDYERVARLKWEALGVIFDDFLKENWSDSGPVPKRGMDFRRYIEQEGEILDEFATFMALERELHRRDPTIWTWQQWPSEYHHPRSAAVDGFKREHWREVLFQKYLQWQIEEQLWDADLYARQAGLALGLYHDLAMAVDSYGADYWANQDLSVSGVEVGAPPDNFSPKGQNWGFPPPDMQRMREEGYRFFIDELKKNCRFGGCLRIDHIMRFFHSFWILHGMGPEDGIYVANPYEEFLGILALESVRSKTLIIGEDLGTVQPFIREALQRYGIFSYRLLYFEKDPRKEFLPPSEYPPSALVSITTHDLPTLCGFWQGLDIEQRRHFRLFPDEQALLNAIKDREEDKKRLLKALIDQGLMPPHSSSDIRDYPEVTGELHSAFVGFLALCRSKLIILNQEDLFKDLRQQNMPGTTWEHKNWVTRMRFKIEELFESPQVAQFALMYRNWILKTNRTVNGIC
jgi:4-alpha-glucanotransferase